ncbi:histidine phosphatase family protein [Henriciella sp. AS95]|uniref:histidine phosphatase family protein n=1 Tax=Henriciella sp. AS95 TaxID=3135782 RepID=UPI00316C14A6
MGSGTSDQKAPRRGPIIVSRHGRPALDRKAGPRLDWQQYRDWWNRYEIGSLAPDQPIPDNLKEAVADADIVLSSTAPRAIETAVLASGRQPESHEVFCEAPLPPPRFKNRKYLPKTWNVLARTAWLYGHSLDGESNRDARERAGRAAQHLHEAAEGGKVYLAAHGWFNRMLRPAMAKLGWVCVRDGGDKYWSYRVYEYRGKS